MLTNAALISATDYIREVVFTRNWKPKYIDDMFTQLHYMFVPNSDKHIFMIRWSSDDADGELEADYALACITNLLLESFVDAGELLLFLLNMNARRLADGSESMRIQQVFRSLGTKLLSRRALRVSAVYSLKMKQFAGDNVVISQENAFWPEIVNKLDEETWTMKFTIKKWFGASLSALKLEIPDYIFYNIRHEVRRPYTKLPLKLTEEFSTGYVSSRRGFVKTFVCFVFCFSTSSQTSFRSPSQTQRPRRHF